MSENMNRSENVELLDDVEIAKRHAAIRTALFVLVLSLVFQVAHYLWQAYCC